MSSNIPVSYLCHVHICSGTWHLAQYVQFKCTSLTAVNVKFSLQFNTFTSDGAIDICMCSGYGKAVRYTFLYVIYKADLERRRPIKYSLRLAPNSKLNERRGCREKEERGKPKCSGGITPLRRWNLALIYRFNGSPRRIGRVNLTFFHPFTVRDMWEWIPGVDFPIVSYYDRVIKVISISKPFWCTSFAGGFRVLEVSGVELIRKNLNVTVWCSTNTTHLQRRFAIFYDTTTLWQHVCVWGAFFQFRDLSQLNKHEFVCSKFNQCYLVNRKINHPYCIPIQTNSSWINLHVPQFEIFQTQLNMKNSSFWRESLLSCSVS